MYNRQILVKLGIAASVLLLASCYSELPELPTATAVDGYKYCHYTTATGADKCKIVDYEMSADACAFAGGELNDVRCDGTEPEVTTDTEPKFYCWYGPQQEQCVGVIGPEGSEIDEDVCRTIYHGEPIEVPCGG